MYRIEVRKLATKTEKGYDRWDEVFTYAVEGLDVPGLIIDIVTNSESVRQDEEEKQQEMPRPIPMPVGTDKDIQEHENRISKSLNGMNWYSPYEDKGHP